jgi:hypothetical protein
MPTRRPVSDTVTVTADGRTVVNVSKLLAKEHVQEMIRQMRAKTTIVRPRSQPNESPKHHSATE